MKLVSCSTRMVTLVVTCLITTSLLTTPLAAQSGPITFTSRAYQPLAESVAVGDFNLDGRLDVASTGYSTESVLVIYKGGTNGALSKVTEYPIEGGGSGAFVYTGDLNSDGKLDLAITKQSQAEIELWWGNGDATFSYAQTLFLNNGPSPVIAIGDVDSSDTLDIVTFEGSGSQIYMSNGMGSFSTNSNLFYVQAPAGAFDFGLADVTGDRRLDLVFISQSAISVFRGSGDGLFSLVATSPISLATTGRMTIGSFNRDVALDIAVRTGTVGTSLMVHVFLNNGAAKFALRSTRAAGTADGREVPAAGDLNNDGVMDLVVPRPYMATDFSPQSTVYLLNNGDGTFSTYYVAGNYGGGPPVLRRFNWDSRMDIVLPSRSGTVTMIANSSAPPNCTPPGSATLAVKICAPGNGATVGTTFTVSAGANSPAGVSFMELFVDGSKKYQLWNDQMKRSVSVTPGRHRITVRAYDRYVGYTQSTVYVTAQ